MPLPVVSRPRSQKADFYDHLLDVSLLLLLQEAPGSSHELRGRLRPLGFEQTATALERALQAMLGTDLVQCSDEPSGAADGGRVYGLTAAGAGWLRQASAELRTTEAILGGFLARFGERFVTP